MNCYKLETGVSKVYKITTREDFEENIKGNKKYLCKGTDGYFRGLGICPLCDNPVRILSLYKKLENKRPYALHCKDGNDEKLVSFNHEKYIHCPYSNPSARQHFDKSIEKYPMTEFEKELCAAVKNNFDKIVRFILDKTDIYISKAFAKNLLEQFYLNFGFRNSETNFSNIPWIMLYCIGRFNLVGRGVKSGSSLWNYLRKRNDIKLSPFEYNHEYDRIESSTGKFIILEGCFYAHTQRIDGDDEVIEKIRFGVADSKDINKDWAYKRIYSIDITEFQNFCKEINYRNQELLDLAKDDIHL